MRASQVRPKIAVSSCLLGERVRYDGGHKELTILTRELKHLFEIVSLCPEMLMGLGVPRPPIYAKEGAGKNLELRTRTEDRDLTYDASKIFQEQIKPQLTDIRAYIFKSRSPSCAVKPLEFNAGEAPVPGVFAKWTLECRSDLVVVDENDLLTARGVLSFCLKVYLAAGLIDQGWASLFENPLISTPNFFSEKNSLKGEEFPKHPELQIFRSLADRLSS